MYINKKLHTSSEVESRFKIVYFFYTPCINEFVLKTANYTENNTWCAKVPDLFRVLNVVSCS